MTVVYHPSNLFHDVMTLVGHPFKTVVGFHSISCCTGQPVMLLSCVFDLAALRVEVTPYCCFINGCPATVAPPEHGPQQVLVSTATLAWGVNLLEGMQQTTARLLCP